MTSYAEIALLPHGADAAHLPSANCFSKPNLSTGTTPSCVAGGHGQRIKSRSGRYMLAVEGSTSGPTEYETDRVRFRAGAEGRSSGGAGAAGQSLRATGPVLDPIFSLRPRVRIAPGSSASLAFTTAVAASRDEALALADQYDHFNGVTRAFELAWAHSQVELRHLNVTAEELHLYQRMAAHVIYAGTALRYAPAVSSNRFGQQQLWRFGISGDLPIVFLRLAEQEDLALVRLLLRAHGYWRLKGLRVDLVLLNDHPASYLEALNEQVQTLIRTSDDHGWENNLAASFCCEPPSEDETHALAGARAVFEAEGFVDQPGRPPAREASARLVTHRAARSGSRAPRSAEANRISVEVAVLNGRGGFGGRARVRHPGEGKMTASRALDQRHRQRDFGCLVSEAGPASPGRSTVSISVGEWSSDPVGDPPAEIIYLDEETANSGRRRRCPQGRRGAPGTPRPGYDL